MSNNSCGKKKEHGGCKLVQGNEVLLLVCTNFGLRTCNVLGQ